MQHRLGRSRKANPFSKSHQDVPAVTQSAAFRHPSGNRRNAIEDACNRINEAVEFHAQHGAVRILMQNGKPGPDATAA